MSARARRRWLRRLAIAASALVLVVGGVYAWALTAVDSSTIARAMVWRDADVGDQQRFPSRVIAAGDQASPLPDGPEIDLTGAVPGGEEVDSAPPRRRTRPPIRRRTTSTSGGSMSNAPGRFYGLGNLGQYIYVAPDADAVIVRNGSDWNIDNDSWLETFREIADQLESSPG